MKLTYWGIDDAIRFVEIDDKSYVIYNTSICRVHSFLKESFKTYDPEYILTIRATPMARFLAELDLLGETSWIELVVEINERNEAKWQYEEELAMIAYEASAWFGSKGPPYSDRGRLIAKRPKRS